MAIYVLLQCCKCNSQKRIHLYSCSLNKDNVSKYLCNHFTINYTYVCKFGFFTLGWSIKLNIRATCNNCYHDLNFGENNFNSRNYSLETHRKCCHNIFRVNVGGYSYGNDLYGTKLQESEDKDRKEKEEIQKVRNIMETQRQEANKLKQENNFDLSFLDNEKMNIINSFDYQMNLELNIDIGELIDKKNEVLKFCKF